MKFLNITRSTVTNNVANASSNYISCYCFSFDFKNKINNKYIKLYKNNIINLYILILN
jgi:hypothetical protein